MHLNVTIDGRLVAHADGAGPGHVFVFHEYGRWSLLAVAAESPGADADDGGTASVILEQTGSLAELARAVDRHGGPGTWRELLDRHGSLGCLAAPAGRRAHAVSLRFR